MPRHTCLLPCHACVSGVKVLRLRGCSIGERGARALAEHLICPGIDLAEEFASRTLLDYPDPLGPRYKYLTTCRQGKVHEKGMVVMRLIVRFRCMYFWTHLFLKKV